MKNTRKPTLFILLGVVMLLAGSISSSHAQSPLDFTGTWQTILMMDGRNSITLTLVQNGDQATGSYPGNGTIQGMVSGRVLRFTWRSDRGSGSGRFVMDEKERAFSGTWNKGNNPDDVDSTWSGLRLVSPEWRPGIKVPIDRLPLPIPGKRREGAPEPISKEQQAELEKKMAEYEESQKNAPATFAGVWRTMSAEKLQFPELLLQQDGSKVAGRLDVNRPELGIIKDGVVEGNTLRFTISRPGRVLFNGRLSPDEYMGTGELVMDADGRSFTGTILGGATSGTLIAR